MPVRHLSISLICLVFCHFVRAEDSGPLVMAHRGGAHEMEENTLHSFSSCYDAGIRGFETDVRMAKDGTLVILHDDSLDRTHNATGPVEHKTADELQAIRTKQGEPFLFVDELLDYLADKPGMYVEFELKTSNKSLYPDVRVQKVCRQLLKAAEAKKPQGSIYVYTSFDHRPLKTIRGLDAQAQTLLTAGKPLSPEFLNEAKQLGVNYIGCQLSGTSRTMVKHAQEQGFKVNCWPGHGVKDYLLCVGLGTDVHCTDIPLAVLEVKEKLSP